MLVAGNCASIDDQSRIIQQISKRKRNYLFLQVKSIFIDLTTIMFSDDDSNLCMYMANIVEDIVSECTCECMRIVRR